MRICPSFHSTLRQSLCRSFLLACLSLTLLENVCANERSLSSASLSARKQVDHLKSDITERALSSAQQSALVPRSPRLSLVKRQVSLDVDDSNLPLNSTLSKSNFTSAPETNNTSHTNSQTQNDSYTDPSPNSNNTSVVPHQKSPELDQSKSTDPNPKLNASLIDPVPQNVTKNRTSLAVSSDSPINQATTIAVSPSTEGNVVTNQSSTQGIQSTDRKLTHDLSSHPEANLTTSDSDNLSSGLLSNHSGQLNVTRVTSSNTPNKTQDNHSDDAYSPGKTFNHTALNNSDPVSSSVDTSISNATRGSSGVLPDKDLSNSTDGGLPGPTVNNGSNNQSVTLSTSAIPLHNNTDFVTSSLSSNPSGDLSSDKSGSKNATSNIPASNNTVLQNATSSFDVIGGPPELLNSSASAWMNSSNNTRLSANKQIFDNTTTIDADNKTTSHNSSADSTPLQNVTSQGTDDDSFFVAPYLKNTGHGTSDFKHNVSSIDHANASSDAVIHFNGTNGNGPESVLPGIYSNRTGLSNNFTIPAGFNGTGIPLSDLKSSNASDTQGGIYGNNTDAVQNFTIPAGVNGSGIPMSTSKSSNDSSDIKGSIDSALSHLGSSSNVSSPYSATETPYGQNFTDATPFNVSGMYNTNTSDEAAAALWRLNRTRAGLSDSSNDLNSTLLASGLGGSTATAAAATTAGTGFSIGSPSGSVGDSTLANLTSTGIPYQNTSVIPLNGEASNASLLNPGVLPINASLLNHGVLPINASLLNETGGVLLPNATANYTATGKLAWNASLDSTQNNTSNTSLAPVLSHNATDDESNTVPQNHTLPVAAPAFVPVSSLFINPTTPPVAPNPITPNTPTPKPKPAEPETQASFPTTWPRYIVPSNTPTSPPDNSTLISILFSNALSWPWLVTNSNASSQVLVFMPALISTALNIDPSEVVTQSLQAYQPADFAADDESAMLTIWLGFIPSQYVNTLQAMLKDPQSAFYNQSNPIYEALSKTVDPSLPITTFSSQARAAQRNAATTTVNDDTPPPANQGQKAAVIASVTSCGAAILAIGLFLAARQSKQKMRPGRIPFSGGSGSGARSNLRALHLPSNGRLQISSPMIGTLSHNAGHATHYYGQGAQRQGEQPSMVQTFAGHSAFPFGHPQGAQASEANVHYEYGHARTTSTDNQYSPPPADNRSSWWKFNQEDLEEPELPANQFDSSHLAEPSPLDRQGNNLRRSDGSFAVDASQRPGPRRLQITRGADGLVSGIGRPVMKENSLFF
ncbi:hypothetical protein DFH28DRAFT_921653 [Melampsora americana]|nr:hypothetical protein DFH28DRAFT_921653 [Melampsora americana]